MSEPVPAWAVACASAIDGAATEDEYGWQPASLEEQARLITEHAEAHARARERAVVEECLRIAEGLGHSGAWKCRNIGPAIRERYVEILREESSGHDTREAQVTNLDTLSREMADLARAHQLGEKDIRARLEPMQARIAELEKALRQISEPDQEPLRDALRANDELRIIEAVTRALNWCRDVAKAALAESESASQPHHPTCDGQHGGHCTCTARHTEFINTSINGSQPELIQHVFVACYHGVGLCVTNPGPDGCHHGEPYCGQPRARHIQGRQSEREG